MCGFVGIANSDNWSWLKRASKSIEHRGPDDVGKYNSENPCYNVHFRRLSIVDIACGSQPMSNEDGTIWVVCNGEIFNSPELRKTLSASGHIFKTHNSDVETLLHLYEEKGDRLVDYLNGMYAFVVFDRKNRRLFGARDRMGIKPLYYMQSGKSFSFASELKALINAPGFTTDIDFQSVYHYLSLQFIPAPDSIFKNIKRLPAGHCFSFNFETASLQIKQYWELTIRPDEGRKKEEWQPLVRKSMEEAVRRWTLADVPIGCSLSGGIDSTALVGFLRKAGVSNLRTFTVGFSGPGMENYNELETARNTSKYFSTVHEEYIVDPETLPDDLESMVWHLDEPYGGGLPSWYIYKMMQGKVKVCMTGSGGDELFGNYEKYRIFEKKLFYYLIKPIVNSFRNHTSRDIRDAVRFSKGYFAWKYIPDSLKKSVVFDNKHWKSFISTEEFYQNFWQRYGNLSVRDIIPCIDFKNQLPEEFLFVTDRFSMAHAIEARVPFLDHELVELVFTIPHSIRIGLSDPKSFMKQSVADMIPSWVLNAPKCGFRLPLKEWSRGRLRELVIDLLNPAALQKQGIFSEKLFGAIVRPHLEGRIDRTEWVWTLLMFQLWYRKFIKYGLTM